jgi:hypothetical protein
MLGAQISNKDLIIELLGKEKGALLMRTKGIAGCRFTFPRSADNVLAKNVHRMIKAIGREAVDVLIRHFDGDSVYIPNDAEYRRYERNKKIVERYTAGASIRELSAEFYLSDRSIFAILKMPGLV